MGKYTVTIEESLIGDYMVTANTQQEAERMALQGLGQDADQHRMLVRTVHKVTLLPGAMPKRTAAMTRVKTAPKKTRRTLTPEARAALAANLVKARAARAKKARVRKAAAKKATRQATARKRARTGT